MTLALEAGRRPTGEMGFADDLVQARLPAKDPTRRMNATGCEIWDDRDVSDRDRRRRG